jgi:hypothetical protein
MKINYNKILRDNMLNAFREILLNILENGLQKDHQLFVTFDTNHTKVKLPTRLKNRYPREMTIVIQYEYWNFIIKKNLFNIGLSFDNVKTDLTIPYDSVISFADPYANFGLRLAKGLGNKEKIKSKNNQAVKAVNKKNNILKFKKISRT